MLISLIFMVKKEGMIPKEILEELDIGKIEKPREDFEVTPIVEAHQVKLPVPPVIRREIEFIRGKKIKVKYDSKERKLIYQI